MQRKLLSICLALAIFAIVPATASATFLTDTNSEGVTRLLPVGAKVKAISEGTAIFRAGSLEVKCNENFMTGTVVRNDGIVEVTIKDAKFQSNLTPEPTKCQSSLGNTTVTIPALTNEAGKTGHWCLKTKANDEFDVFGRNCGVEGNGVLTFILDVAGQECGYKREAAASGHFTTPPEHKPSTFRITNEPTFVRHVGSTLFCPAEGKITEMAFFLYTDTALEAETNVWDDTKSTGDPVWASEKE